MHSDVQGIVRMTIAQQQFLSQHAIGVVYAWVVGILRLWDSVGSGCVLCAIKIMIMSQLKSVYTQQITA